VVTPRSFLLRAKQTSDDCNERTAIEAAEMIATNETNHRRQVASPYQIREKEPLTVTMVTRRPPSEHGGVERVVAGLLGEISRARPTWRVDAISAFRKGSRAEGIDGLSDAIASIRLGWRLRESAADVVFVFCPECIWGIRLLRSIRLLRKRRVGPPLVAVWCGAGPTPYLVLREPGDLWARALAWLRTTEEKQALAVDGHIAVHKVVADDLRNLYGLNKNIEIIEPALDPTISAQLDQSAARRDRTGLTAAWVGQVGYRKGLPVALAAVAEARRDLPELRLIVAGVPAGQEIEGVDWLGVVPPSAVADVYREADLFIFPTRYESFGLVVIEAMAAGLPVIVSDAVPAGIVSDGRNGVVVAGHNPSDYAVALRRLASPEIRAMMASANRADARRFSIKSAGADYAAVAELFAGVREPGFTGEILG
jgi:glycosyltransferase involved in cell wall biosynthesis